MPVVVLGTLALAGYVTVKRALDSAVDTDDLEPAIDLTVLESAVEANGLRAVADMETLDAAINDDELDRDVDVQRLQSRVEAKLTAVEQAMDSGDIDTILAEEFDAATDRGLSTISEQEVVEGTIDTDEISVSVDIDELRSVLDSGTAALDRTTDVITEKIDAETDDSTLDMGNEPADEGQRIAVVDERGTLDSVVADESDAAGDSKP